MTERLTDLLHDEAADLAVPPAPAAAVLHRGRRLRTGRRLGSGVAVAAALGVVAASGVLLQHTFTPAEKGGRPDAVDPLATYVEGGAYAVGSTVWFGDGHASVDVQGKVKALYYTSAGVVIRSGQVPWTDDGGPNHYALVTPDGQLTPLSLTVRDVKPGTSPGSPYVAYASGERGGASWTVHFYDVRSGRDAATVDVAGAFTWGGWAAPPIALDGDTAYVALDHAMVAVDRATGSVHAVDSLPAAYFPTVAGGRGERPADGPQNTDEIVDVSTGDVVLSEATAPDGVPARAFDSFTRLSPEGGYALRTQEVFTSAADAPDATVYDLATGDSRALPGFEYDLGWTPDGHLLKVTRSRVSVCEPITGACETSQVDLPKGTIRIGGNDNES